MYMRDGTLSTACAFQSHVKSLVVQALWDGLSWDTVSAILHAQAEVQKYRGNR